MPTETAPIDWYLAARDLYWSLLAALPYVEADKEHPELSGEIAAELRSTRDKYEGKFS